MQVTLDLSFRQAVNGCNQHITVSVVANCPNCDGAKVEPGTSKQRCYHCNGTGRVSDNDAKYCMCICRVFLTLLEILELY